MVKDLFVNHSKQVSSAAVNVLDFITGNEDAVQCVPEILKESHRCCCFVLPERFVHLVMCQSCLIMCIRAAMPLLLMITRKVDV